MAGRRNFTGRADYIRRHAGVVRPYLTPHKLANLALNELEMRLARPRPLSVAPYIKIESTPLCHMSCLGCRHNSKDYKKTLHNKMHLTVERLAQVIDPVARELIGVSLSYGGEPLLNRRLPDLVAYVHSRRICTSFPTNLSVPIGDEEAEALVAAGLDLMLVSLDGASAETYEQYRVGGNFQLVLDNVRRLADAKRRLGATRPIITWKMVVFPHNAHEVEPAGQTAASLGFDACEFVVDRYGPEYIAMAADKKRRMVEGRKPCFWAWNTAVVGWDGTVQPCCWQINKIPLGNASEIGLRAVLRSDAYARLRAGFSRKDYGETMHPICRKCIGLPDAPAEVAGAVEEDALVSAT